MQNIILLSGGSGVRLWPLSNNAKAKQFLPLLESEEGLMESMFQRLVRQIRQKMPSARIIVAANQQQKDMIEDQAGGEVIFILEPERRNTFAAVALASHYLLDKEGLDESDTALVMPCDTYTGDDFFSSLPRLLEEAGKGRHDFVMAGVRPTYPSAKYGYGIPSEVIVDGVIPLRAFKEKPSAQEAEALIREGALWNSGAVAFRLGTVSRLLGSCSYEQMLKDYKAIPYISFDHQVLEHSSSMAMIPYDGSWKDLGTWNTLTDELPSNSIGNALLGQENENTYVVNELGIPVFADGLKDMIVAASPDGILVCSRKQSEFLKAHVTDLGTRPMHEQRRWGTYRVVDSEQFTDGFRCLTKSITLKAGRNISYQVHHHRSEVWTFVDGEGLLMLDGKITKVSRGYVANIPVGMKHAVKALTDLTFIEVQSGDLLEEHDIDRLSMSWPDEEGPAKGE